METTTYLKDLKVGTVGEIVGYDKAFGGYIGKLRSMRLTPGTEFTVTHIASYGFPIVIRVDDLNIILRKPEAEALCIEASNC